MVDNTTKAIWCAFCEFEADYLIEESNMPICSICLEVYEYGQATPDYGVKRIHDEDDDEEDYDETA